MSFHSISLDHLARAPLQQSLAFDAALTHLGRPPLRLALPGGAGEVQMVRRRICGVKVGLVSRADIPRHALRSVAKRAGVSVVLLNPETAEGGHGLCLRTPAHVAELDLTVPESDLRARMRQKWRNRLNRSETMGLRLSETALPTNFRHWLLDLEADQARKRGYANWPADLTLAFARANRAQARLFEARRSGETIAAMLFLSHGHVATYHMGWSGTEGRACGAHHALMWHAMRRLKERGNLRIDLGQIATDHASGLARFKLGTGATLRQLGGSWIAMPRLMARKLAVIEKDSPSVI